MNLELYISYATLFATALFCIFSYRKKCQKLYEYIKLDDIYILF